MKKSHTTPYHPMGDGLVERMNRSLLNLLRVFTDSRHDWEEHLQLLLFFYRTARHSSTGLFFYRTARHSSTGLSPYEVLFGNNPPLLHLSFNITIMMGKTEQTVHVNRVCPLLETSPTSLTEPQSPSVNWCPLFAHQEEIESSPATLSAPQATFPAPVITRSGHLEKPVDRYGDHVTH